MSEELARRVAGYVDGLRVLEQRFGLRIQAAATRDMATGALVVGLEIVVAEAEQLNTEKQRGFDAETRRRRGSQRG